MPGPEVVLSPARVLAKRGPLVPTEIQGITVTRPRQSYAEDPDPEPRGVRRGLVAAAGARLRTR